MKIIKKKSDFLLVPPDSYEAVLVGIREYTNPTNQKESIIWDFRILEPQSEFNGQRVSCFSPMALTDTNQTGKIVKTLGFDPENMEEGDEFEPKMLLGACCMVSVDYGKRGDKTFVDKVLRSRERNGVKLKLDKDGVPILGKSSVQDEHPKPTKKTPVADDDENDLPKPRGRKHEDEDEETPRRRRVEETVEPDDKPRSRRRLNDEDEDEE